jgi:MFS family permease
MGRGSVRLHDDASAAGLDGPRSAGGSTFSTVSLELDEPSLEAASLAEAVALEGGAPSSNEESGEGGSGGALSSLPEVNIFACRQAGYLLQYFAVGLIYGGLPATAYGFFLGYLSVPAHVYATVRVILVLPWSFKFAFGMLNDTRPIFHYRRKPYMVIGWACCAMMLVVLAMTPLPGPYWCRNATTGEADFDSPPCNPHSRVQGGGFAFLMMLAAVGYVVADVAADGLTVELARREPQHRRGKLQSTAYMVRTLGIISATLLVGLGMNGPEYNGSFQSGMSFSAVCAILAVPSACMVPVSWFLIEEEPHVRTRSTRSYLTATWSLLRSRAFFHVILFQFLVSAILNIQTPAIGVVKQHWAGVKNLQASLFQLFGHALFVIGLGLVRKYGLHLNWRWLLLGSQAMLQLFDAPFQFCTIFDVVRNQYFYRTFSASTSGSAPLPCLCLFPASSSHRRSLHRDPPPQSGRPS